MISAVKYLLLSTINDTLQNKLLDNEVKSLFRQIRNRELQKFCKDRYLLVRGRYDPIDIQAFLFFFYELYDRKKHSAVQSAMHDIKVNVIDILDNFDYWEAEFSKFHVTLTKKAYLVPLKSDLIFEKHKYFKTARLGHRTKNFEETLSVEDVDTYELHNHEQSISHHESLSSQSQVEEPSSL